jgi:DHA2 family multidrug resistance protein-like MFS transporter
MAENVGWRWIFFASAAVSLVGMLMVRGTPESRAEAKRGYKFDTTGILTFMIAMVALQVFATQGAKFWLDERRVTWPVGGQPGVRRDVLPHRIS